MATRGSSAKKKAPAKGTAAKSKTSASKTTPPSRRSVSEKATPAKKVASAKKPTPSRSAPAKAAAAEPASANGSAPSRSAKDVSVAKRSASVKKASAAEKAPAKRSGSASRSTSAKKAPADTSGSATKSGSAKEASAKRSSAEKAEKPVRSPFKAAFLKRQRQLLLEERATYVHQAETLQAEADSLVADFVSGDVQFDEESGEGDTLNIERERDLTLSAQAREAVAEIDHALAKFESGTYGICETSGLPIPEERLEAIPWATQRVEYKVAGLGRR